MSQKPISALNGESRLDTTGSARFDITKLLDVFFARTIAALPTADGVVIVTADPGLCISELSRNIPPSLRYFAQVEARLMTRRGLCTGAIRTH